MCIIKLNCNLSYAVVLSSIVLKQVIVLLHDLIEQ
jgi:hypothetical protein